MPRQVSRSYAGRQLGEDLLELAFACNEATRAFEVNELQASKRPRRVEKWNGYYFARRERIVVVLRGEGRILRDTPKFYVLNTPHADEGESVTEIGGTMLKLGSGGTHRGISRQGAVAARSGCFRKMRRTPNH